MALPTLPRLPKLSQQVLASPDQHAVNDNPFGDLFPFDPLGGSGGGIATGDPFNIGVLSGLLGGFGAGDPFGVGSGSIGGSGGGGLTPIIYVGGSAGGSGNVKATPVSSGSGFSFLNFFGADLGRLAAFLLGLILIIAGLYLFKPVQKTVNQTIGKGLKASSSTLLA